MPRLPTLFISHGSPTFAIDPGQAGPALSALGQTLPRPKAILVVSPHWTTREPRVATTARPETIHDFGGFPPALYQLQYPAPGAPDVAQRAIELLRAAGYAAEADARWGLDHGAWVPLLHLWPSADVPVFQVSLPARLDGPGAYAYGQALAPHAARAHPTAEHLWPLLVAAGAAGGHSVPQHIDGGVRYGVLSMDGFAWGVPEG